ncbi:MAG: hypothetical protein ABI340_08170 [Nitrososphaera sp.]|jgi:hypothetical protein
MISKEYIKFDPDDILPDADWNKRLLSSEFGSIFQTVEYGEYEKTISNSQPQYLKFRHESNIVGQILLFKVRGGKGKLTKFIPRIKWVWTHGPVVFDSSYYAVISEHLFDFLKFKKFEGTPHPQDKKLFMLQEKYNLKKEETATFIIDLNQELLTILKNTDKKSVQKNIERAYERGVTVNEISTEEHIKYYSDILNQYRESSSLPGYTYEQIKKAFSLAKYVGNGTGFLAWYDKVPIGGIFISAFNGYINEWGIARSNIDTEKKLYAQDLLRWKIIEWGKKKGCRFYDLSGVKYPEEQQSTKEKGIFQNKKKWGGELTPYPIFKK